MSYVYNQAIKVAIKVNVKVIKTKKRLKRIIIVKGLKRLNINNIYVLILLGNYI
jgi:hypothetical protein